MTGWSGWWRGCVFLIVACGVAASPQPARAWCWRSGHHFAGSFAGWHPGWHGGWRPVCGYGFSNFSYSAVGFSNGWGVGLCGPRVFSYSCGPVYAYGCGPYGANLGWYPYGYGCYGWGGWGCLPVSYAPVYGPAGVWPFFGFATASPAVRTAAMPPIALAANAAAPPPPFVPASNATSRMQAARLIAIGDRHLQASLQDRGQLAKALDAYRRAALVARDQADTHLRQAIVLQAMARPEAAEKAVERAVAIDARLGTDEVAARMAEKRLPPDPVFGDGPAGGPTALAVRSGSLLDRIFRDAPAVTAGSRENWIAACWMSRLQDPAARLASR